MDATGIRQISRLIAQYFELLDLRNLLIPSSTVLKPAEIQNRIFTELFDDDHLAPVIPPASYRLKVLKKLIITIENDPDWDPEEDEIIEPLLMAMMSLMSQPSEKNLSSGLDGEEPELSYVSYTLPQTEKQEEEEETGKDRKQVTTFESRGLIYGSGSTGFRTWEAALHLGTYLCSITSSSPVSIRGKKVIELGAGTGFISLLCQKFLGAEKVLMTDGNAKLIDVFNGPCLEQNGLADASQRIKGKQWTWGEPMSVDGTEKPFDIALGADLTYDKAIIPLLVDSISRLFTEHGVETFVISATIRNQDTFDVFLDACRSRRFNLQKSDFESPALEHQTGFFHSSQVPILIYLISPP